MSVLTKIKKSSKTETPKSVTLVVGNVWSRVSGNLPHKAKNRIDEKLSFFVQGAYYTKAYRDDIWDGRIRFFKKSTGIFPTGFCLTVKKILKKKKIKFKTLDKRRIIEYDDKFIKKVIRFNKKIVPRTFQKKAFIKFLEKGAGVFHLPTGSGKTIIMNLIIKAIDSFSDKEIQLVLTHGTSLLSQLRDEISSFQKEEIGYIAEGVWDEKRITVASVDTIFSNLKNPYKLRKTKRKKTKEEKRDKIKERKALVRKTESLLRRATAVHCDEAHHSPAKTFKTVLNKTLNASFRTGFTATYDRSGGDEMSLHAVTGKVVFKRSLSWMIDRGYLAKPTIILMSFDKGSTNEEEWHKEYAKGISTNKARNRILAKVLYTFFSYNLSSIMFVQRKLHGEELLNILVEKHNIPTTLSRFLMGRDDNETVRKPTLNAFQKGEIRNIICTRILNEGVDFPEANAGIRCSAQKYEGGIIQQLGRILRKTKPKSSKDINRKILQRVFWFDLMDMHSPTLADHALNRAKVYESERAFDVRYVDSFKGLREILDEQIKEVKIINKKNASYKKNTN